MSSHHVKPIHHACPSANTALAHLVSLERNADSQSKLGSTYTAAAVESAKDEAVQVIADITRRMGDGMAKYIQQDVETIADYDEYCHFVAGLVGVGLSQV